MHSRSTLTPPTESPCSSGCPTQKYATPEQRVAVALHDLRPGRSGVRGRTLFGDGVRGDAAHTRNRPQDGAGRTIEARALAAVTGQRRGRRRRARRRLACRARRWTATAEQSGAPALAIPSRSRRSSICFWAWPSPRRSSRQDAQSAWTQLSPCGSSRKVGGRVE